MSTLLIRLIRSEKVTKEILHDSTLMKINLDVWLSQGLITQDEFDKLHEEL